MEFQKSNFYLQGLMALRYSMFNEPLKNETSEAFGKRFNEEYEKLEELANQSKEAYRTFRIKIKKELNY